MVNFDQVQIPSNIIEALQHPNLRAAAFEEMQALEKNNTWQITELPPRKRIVGCKWISTVKHKTDGSIERFEARLAALRVYSDTWYRLSRDLRLCSHAKYGWFVYSSIAANLDWPLYQVNVKNDFLMEIWKKKSTCVLHLDSNPKLPLIKFVD